MNDLVAQSLPWGYREICDILPHRKPFLFVDKVTAFDADRSIQGLKTWGPGDCPLQTPDGRPMVPASLLIEAMAQLGAILILRKPENRGKLIYFMGIEKARYRRPVQPGDPLLMSARVVRLRSKVGFLMGEATVDGATVLSGKMHFALGGEA